MKNVATKVAGLRKLVQQVEQLGDLRAQKSTLEAAERELSETVQKGIEIRKLEQVTSQTYVAQLAGRPRLVINPARFRRFCMRKATDRVFLGCIRVDNKAARARFPDNGMAGLGKMINSTVLRVSKRPVATEKRK